MVRADRAVDVFSLEHFLVCGGDGPGEISALTELLGVSALITLDVGIEDARQVRLLASFNPAVHR